MTVNINNKEISQICRFKSQKQSDLTSVHLGANG